MSRGMFGLLALLTLVFAPTLPAAICSSTTSCTFDFTVTNVGPNFTPPADGSFGTVQLTLSGGVITFNIVMDAGYKIVNTGFPNGENPQQALGFNDNLGNAGTGYLTFGNFTSPYVGPGESGGTHQFDGFGNFMDAALTAPQNGAGCGTCVGTASFTVSKAGGFTSVQQLISASAASKGAYFVLDIFGDASVCSGACTGLVAVVPEPGFYGMLAIGLGGLFVAIDKRRKTAKS